MKKINLPLLFGFMLIYSGCATIDSDNASDRMMALSSITDQVELGKCVESARYMDVKLGALDRITNTTILVSVAINQTIDEELRNAAAVKLYDEDPIVRVLSKPLSETVVQELAKRIRTEDGMLRCVRCPISDNIKKELLNNLTSSSAIVSVATDCDVSPIVRDYAALKIKDESNSLLVLSKSSVSETVGLALLGNVEGEKNLLKLCENGEFPTKLQIEALKRIGDNELIFSVVANEGLKSELRIAALQKLKEDSEYLKKVMVQCSDIAVSHRTLLLLKDNDVDDGKVQECLNKWCLTLGGNRSADGDVFLNDIIIRIRSQKILWAVVNNQTLPSEVKRKAVEKLSDMKQVCEIILKDHYDDVLRKCAVEKLKNNPSDLESCLNVISDIGVGIIIAKTLPRENILQDKVQRRFLEWFSRSNDRQVVMDLLDMFRDNLEMTREAQQKIFQLAENPDAEGIRKSGSRFLTDPLLIENCISKNEKDEQYMLWASTLISSDVYRERILNKISNVTVRGFIVSQMSSEDRILRIAKADSDSAIRVVAIKHLSQSSSAGLRSLFEDEDEIVSSCALGRLKQVNPEAAKELQATANARDEAKRKKAIKLKEEDAARDWDRAKQEVLNEVSTLRTTFKQILDLQDCAVIASKKGCAPRFKAVLTGTVVSIDDSWLSKEFVIQATGNGHSLTCHCEPSSGIPKGVSQGSVVTVLGTFKKGNGNSVTLENVVLK